MGRVSFLPPFPLGFSVFGMRISAPWRLTSVKKDITIVSVKSLYRRESGRRRRPSQWNNRAESIPVFHEAKNAYSRKIITGAVLKLWKAAKEYGAVSHLLRDRAG